eukprot:SAG31_NODE_32110_length_360_cov_0.593870_1_plen_94_part_10
MPQELSGNHYNGRQRQRRPSEVANVLKDHGLGQWSQQFVDHSVSGDTLEMLDDEGLEELLLLLGIPRRARRVIRVIKPLLAYGCDDIGFEGATV